MWVSYRATTFDVLHVPIETPFGPLVVVLGSVLVAGSLSVVSRCLEFVAHASKSSSQSGIGWNVRVTCDTATMLEG